MLGASKRNLFSANYAMLVITEMAADSGDRQVTAWYAGTGQASGQGAQ